MTDQDQPKLVLGQPPGGLKKIGQIPKAWLWLFLSLHVVMLICLAGLWMRPAGRLALPSAAPSPGSAEDLKAAAIELQERSLDVQAAQAWEAYLQAEPRAPNRAQILYRIGSLYMQADQFDQAAAALVRSELAAADDEDLQRKRGPKLVECLRRLGLYGEVGRELSRQVEVGAKETGRGKVLATLAGEELTEADLDRMIQRRVDQMLAMQGTAEDEAARQAILRQLSSPQARQQILQELLQTELFCRRARELKLDREEEFLQARQHLEQSLLANRFLSKQLEKIQPTDVDLQSYYKANQDRYQEPESAEVRVIRLGEEEDVTKLVEKIRSPDDFRKLAAQRGPSGASGDQPPVARRIIRGRTDALLGDAESLFGLSEGEWTKEPHAAGGQKSLVLVEKKIPAHTPPLAEVRDRVRADYLRVKQQQWSEKLFRDLLTRYDVQIMPPGETTEEAAKPAGDESKSEEEPSLEADEEQTP